MKYIGLTNWLISLTYISTGEGMRMYVRDIINPDLLDELVEDGFTFKRQQDAP